MRLSNERQRCVQLGKFEAGPMLEGAVLVEVLVEPPEVGPGGGAGTREGFLELLSCLIF